MKTSAEFQARLTELQNEQRDIISSGGRRTKVGRARCQEINKEFYSTRDQWREVCGDVF
jgi:hypothetical protein